MQVIGKILVLWRENPEKAKARAQAARPAPRKSRPEEARGRLKPSEEAPQRRGAHSYRTSTISNSFTPPGVRTSATSPENFPMRALAIGEE